MNNIKISVIIPVYNTEEYLEETLESILNQTMIDDIEVLMLDDGSDDYSQYIIEKYAREYDNFHAFFNENMGSGVERNIGIKQARGEYIHLMDSDDLLQPRSYEILYDFAKSDDYDFVLGCAMKINKRSFYKEDLQSFTFKGVENEITSTNIKERPLLVYDTGVWNKIIKREYLIKNDIFFPDEKIMTQDLIFNLKLHCLTDKVGMIKEFVYFWRERDDSSSVTQQKSTIVNFRNRMRILNMQENLMNKCDVDDNIREAEYLKWLNHDLRFYVRRIAVYPEEYRKEIVDKVNCILSLIPDNLKDNIISYRRIIYKMVENRDMESLLKIENLESDLPYHPELAKDLKEEYQDLIDFRKDAVNEDLITRFIYSEIEGDNLAIFVREHPKYIKNENPDFIEFKLVESKNSFSIEDCLRNLETEEGISIKYEIKEDDVYKLIIPYDDLKDLKGRYFIRTRYVNGDIKKEALIETRKRKNILNLKNKELITTQTTYKLLCLVLNDKRKEEIKISEINIINSSGNVREFFKDTDNADAINAEKLENPLIESTLDTDKTFNIIFESKMKIESLILEQRINFKQRKINVNCLNDGPKYKYEINIPFEWLLRYPIQKWELKNEDNINITISNSTIYMNNTVKINFKNYKNKLHINAEYYSKNNELKKLTLENEKLKDTVEAYKSRKVIKIADKLRNRIR